MNYKPWWVIFQTLPFVKKVSRQRPLARVLAAHPCGYALAPGGPESSAAWCRVGVWKSKGFQLQTSSKREERHGKAEIVRTFWMVFGKIMTCKYPKDPQSKFDVDERWIERWIVDIALIPRFEDRFALLLGSWGLELSMDVVRNLTGSWSNKQFWFTTIDYNLTIIYINKRKTSHIKIYIIKWWTT